MNEPQAAYELSVSRIFTASSRAVRHALTDSGLRGRWGGPMTAREERDGAISMSGPAAGDAGPLALIRLYAESGGTTRLELRAGPYTEAGEIEARAQWNSAFSRLDTLLEEGLPGH
jgi:hypothetical protein